MQVHGSGTIARPLQEVFDFVADMRNDVQWAPLVDKVVQVQGDGPHKGARWRIQQRLGKRVRPMEIEMTAYERPALLCWRMYPKGGTVDATMMFAKHAHGTRLRQTNTYGLQVPWHLRFMVRLTSRRVLRKQMRNLRKVLEEG